MAKKQAGDKQKFIFKILLLSAGLLVAIVVSFGVGYYPLTPQQVWQAVLAGLGFSSDALPQAITIFWNIRLPRILAAVLIGSALSVSGSVYQSMFRNPLVSPDILGVSAGAGLGASLAIFSGLSQGYVQLFAFVAAAAAVALSYAVSCKSAHNQALTLVLAGTMVGVLCNSVVTAVKYIADPIDVLQQLTFWLMGSLAKVTMENLAFSIVPMLIGFVAIFLLRWRINILTLPDEEARSLGVSPSRYRFILVCAATLLSASAVCLGGLIGFVGLMVPHICRAIFGADTARLIPGTALLGGIFLLLVDNLARTLLTVELPIGMLTAFIGAPFFMGLVLRRKGAVHVTD